MKKKSIELFEELVRLWGKYGKASFSELSDLLKEEDFIKINIDILSRLPRTMKSRKISRSVQGKNTAERLTQRIDSIQIKNPEKAEILTFLYQRLLSKEILPTLKQLNNYMFDHHFSNVISSRRDQAITRLMNVLLDMDVYELQKIRDAIPQTPIDDQQSLEKWSNIITRKDNDDRLR